MSAAGPSRGRLHELGEAQARSARPRVRAAADTQPFGLSVDGKEAASAAASLGQQSCAAVECRPPSMLADARFAPGLRPARMEGSGGSAAAELDNEAASVGGQ